MKMTKVRELMTSGVVTIRARDSLARAARLMYDHDCGSLPVVDEGGRPVAMITDRDICMAALREDLALSDVEVRAAMSASVFACKGADSIEDAERLMGQHQVRRLPVVREDGRLEGILSLDDIAEEACRDTELVAPPVSAEAVGLTLGQIGRPHLVTEPGD